MEDEGIGLPLRACGQLMSLIGISHTTLYSLLFYNMPEWVHCGDGDWTAFLVHIIDVIVLDVVLRFEGSEALEISLNPSRICCDKSFFIEGGTNRDLRSGCRCRKYCAQFLYSLGTPSCSY
jgi:hypothetical protein